MTKPIKIIDDGVSSVELYSEWLKNADSYFELCLSTIDWHSRVIWMFGKQHTIPRREAWVGDAGVKYRYSGQDYIAEGWPAGLDRVAVNIRELSNSAVNSALLNYYRDGQSSMGWHSDNEKELGENPTIIILSLGGSRTMQLRETANTKNKISIDLEHGSLLVMRGATQHHWQHAIPKRAKGEARVSCTFRQVSET